MELLVYFNLLKKHGILIWSQYLVTDRCLQRLLLCRAEVDVRGWSLWHHRVMQSCPVPRAPGVPLTKSPPEPVAQRSMAVPFCTKHLTSIRELRSCVGP